MAGSRVSERQAFDDRTRLTLVEGDLDAQDNELAAIRGQLGKVLWTMVGLLISVSTACVLLGLNLAVGR